METTGVFKDKYVYKLIDSKFDIISGRYKLTIRKFWTTYHWRKAINNYDVTYANLSVFVTKETPILEQTENKEMAVRILADNWIDVLEYAINKSEPNWITYSESNKHVEEEISKNDYIEYLGITINQFDKLKIDKATVRDKKDKNGKMEDTK